MKGKLIVIEGIDGSGKQTQVQALEKHFASKGIKVKTISFPRYDHFFGKLTQDLLRGKLGDFTKVSPYLGALPYALDRRQVNKQMATWLQKGYLVLADRYVSANIAFQTAKLPKAKRGSFIKWLKKLEYQINNMPKEDLVIILDLPIATSQKWLKKEKSQDEAEKNTSYQQKVAQVYRQLAITNKDWVLVKGEGAISKVSARILTVIKKELNL